MSTPISCHNNACTANHDIMIIIRWFERKEYLSYEAIVKARNNLPRLMKRMKIMKTGMKYRDLRVLAMFPY